MKPLLFKVILLIQIFEVCLLKQVHALESVKEYHVSSFENPYFNTSRVQFGKDTVVYSQNDINKIADSLAQKVERENRIVDMLEPNKAYTLPIGIVKDMGGLKYTIVLDELRFSSIELTAKAYMSLSFPGSSKKIGFVADDVKISVDGIRSVNLRLMSDQPIDILGNNNLIVKADSTFIEWDCNGYKAAQISARLVLNPSTFLKENPLTRDVISGATVTGRVFCAVEDFNDIILGVSIDPFQVKGLKDFSFYPKEIYLDLSDKRNIESIQFPLGYESVLFDGQNRCNWRGLYIKSFALKFPKSFTKSGFSPEVSVSRFIVDMEGITGIVSLNYPLLTLDQGDIGGWKFSINSLSITLNKNDFAGFGMSGGIVLPITEQNKPLSYRASIDANKNFLFQVTLPGNINVPLFGSESSLSINSNSIISVESRNGEFYPKAILHGKMKIGAGGSSGASLADIVFQGLTIQREEPQLDIQSLSMQSGVMAGFPVQINKIAVEKKEKDLGLQFDVSANLMDGKIQGATSFIIWASRSSGSWKYKDFELRKIAVDANTGAISLRGVLINYKDDQVYGNGYLGSVAMSVIPGISISATAQFGNVSGYRYWYADASVTIPTGIPIFTGFGIYGFGGGAYYHMQRNLPTEIVMSTTAPLTNTVIEVPGRTGSGITYTPSKDIALGLSAKVIIGTQPSPKAFNGSVGFGIEFTSSLGVSKIYFEGEGRFMTEVASNGADAKVRAIVNIQYSFDKNELSGFAEAFINVADAIKGSGANNSAGRIEFYFAKSKWHIYVGTPSSPVGITIMNVLTATSYFMVGTELPDFPPLPANVASLSSGINFSNMRSESLTKTGGGFAFGASIMASTGDRKFLIFYGSFDLGAGFDLMLKNFGNDARCEGFSGPLGINGWYAQGQAWSYVDAKIGVRVKVLHKERRFNIINAGFAAALGAQLPNPTYFAGAVEAYFSVLGGLVKGKCHFEFDYGTQCKLVNTSAVEGVAVIADVTPNNGGNDIDVFIAPQVAFNMPINQPFSILDTDNKTKSFRVVLDYFKILDNGQEINVNREWNNRKDVLAIRPSEVLPGQKQLTIMVKVHFEVSNSSGNWQSYTVNGNEEIEERTVTFVTGNAPDYITESNVSYSYPVKNMVNFYKQEYGKCFIQVKTGVNYLFNKEGDWAYVARFKSRSNTLNMAVLYNSSQKRVEFDIPASLNNSEIYQIRILRVPAGNSTLVVDKNVNKNEIEINKDQSVTTSSIEGILSEEGVSELYSLYFRSSKYNSLSEKISSFSSSIMIENIGQSISILKLKFKGDELFDVWEVENIKVDAIVDETAWYEDNYKGLLYSSYPIEEGMTLNWRDYNNIGYPPVRCGSIVQSQSLPLLTEKDISTGTYYLESNLDVKFENKLSYYISGDYLDLKTKAFSLYPQTSKPSINKIKSSSFIGIKFKSQYPINIKYFIPGEANPSSETKSFIEI